MIMPAVLDDLGLTPRQMSVARILLRFGIISIREAAKFARVSKNTAQAAIQRLEQAKTITAHKIKGRTSQYLFSKAVLKMFKGSVPKRAFTLSQKRIHLRNSEEKLSEMRLKRWSKAYMKRLKEEVDPKAMALWERAKAISGKILDFDAIKQAAEELKTAKT